MLDAYDLQEMASRIMHDLGAGYSESIYQRALFNKIIKTDTTAVKEQIIQVTYENEPIGTCRADIVTSSHIIEIKAVRTMPVKVGAQISKYMKHLFDKDHISREGMVINFNQEYARVDFLIFPPLIKASTRPAEHRRRRITPNE